MLPRSDIEAIDRPTVLSMLCSMISAQQTFCLKTLPKMTTLFPSRYGIYQTTLQWLSSYGCTIIILYIMVLDGVLMLSWLTSGRYIYILAESILHTV